MSKARTIKEELFRAVELLMEAGVDTAQLDAEVLMAHFSGRPRVYIIAHPEDPLTEYQALQYREMVKRRTKREPLAYITGVREFWGLEFEVIPAALIPRPETETLVETALSQLRGLDKPVIVDIGAGSGCISVALAVELPEATIYAAELSHDALQVARRNVVKHQVEDRVHLLEGDLLDSVPRELLGGLDAIVSNPPYIPSLEIKLLQPEIANYEPRKALNGGRYGLSCLEEIIRDAGIWLKPDGCMHVEVGAGQAERVTAIARNQGFKVIHVTKDLAGIERVVSCQKPADS